MANFLVHMATTRETETMWKTNDLLQGIPFYLFSYHLPRGTRTRTIAQVCLTKNLVRSKGINLLSQRNPGWLFYGWALSVWATEFKWRSHSTLGGPSHNKGNNEMLCEVTKKWAALNWAPTSTLSTGCPLWFSFGWTLTWVNNWFHLGNPLCKK